MSVSETQPVRVEVFDVLGRRVAVLHDAPLHALRNRVFEIDAANWAAGVYLVRIAGAAFTVSEPVIPVR